MTLSEVNRRKQIDDGAPVGKIDIVPNGVDAPATRAPRRGRRRQRGAGRAGVIAAAPAPLRVGFVGRVVPIKDLITFVRACDLALRTVDLDVRIIGPVDEDAGLRGPLPRAGRAARARTSRSRFVGPMPPAEIYGDLDLVVLTSFSEGQPLVILEAYACGVPVLATDVGACREMIEGRDRRGPRARRRAASSARSPRPRRRPRRWSGWRTNRGCAGAWARPGHGG